MILNANQYQATQTALEQFKQARVVVAANADMHPIQRQAYLDAYQSTIDDLTEQLAEYDRKGKE